MSAQPFRLSLSSGGLLSIERSQVIRIAGELGFDALDLHCVEPHLSRARARRDRTLIQLDLQMSNLKLAALSLETNFVEPNLGLRSREEVLEYLELARPYGTPLINITVSPPEFEELLPDGWEILEEFLTPCIEAAERRRVRLGVETPAGTIMGMPQNILRLLDRFDSPALGIALDLAAVVVSGGDPEALIAQIGGRVFLLRIRDVHLSSESGEPEWTPLGEGMIAYPSILRALIATGYQGYLSLEAFSPSLEANLREAVARDTAYLKRLTRCYAR